MKKSKYFFIILFSAVLIKLFLFVFAVVYAPGSKFSPDSADYLENARMLYSRGIFARVDKDGILKSEVIRTPGYPFFLAALHHAMKIPLSGIIILQIILTIFAAFITYKTAYQIDPRIGILSAAIVLYDIPITVWSLRILTEALFLFLLSSFIYYFILYLKKGNIKSIMLSALILAAATYVRPISYYLGSAISIFIIFAKIPNNFKRTLQHALLFLVITYSLLGAWQIRNYECRRISLFSTVAENNFKIHGLVKAGPESKNLFAQDIASVFHYVNNSWHCFLSFMTGPGSLKYFKSRPLAIVGKIVAYPWMVFWMTGFLFGVIKIGRNIYYQFMLFVILYFLCVTILNISLVSDSRFRVPIVPCIAIISAYGWLILYALIKNRVAKFYLTKNEVAR